MIVVLWSLNSRVGTIPSLRRDEVDSVAQVLYYLCGELNANASVLTVQ